MVDILIVAPRVCQKMERVKVGAIIRPWFNAYLATKGQIQSFKKN